MGLDMYLQKRIIGSSAQWEEVVYWRKSNQIRAWFSKNLENFQDNGTTPIYQENIENLISVCKTVLKTPEKAPELLPTSEGFFFSDEEYTEYYFCDIEHTVSELEKVLHNTNFQLEELNYWEWY